MTKKEDVDWEGYIITSKQWADGQYISLETLYQAFKERTVKEILEGIVNHEED